MKKAVFVLLLLLVACNLVSKPEIVPSPTPEPVVESTPETKVVEEQETLLGVPTIILRETGVVERVLDADTLLVKLDQGAVVRVRLIGVDFPDLDAPQLSYWTRKGWTEENVRLCYDFGNKAMRESVEGLRVTLWSDHTELDKDQYDQLLRYVTLDEEGLILNEFLIYEGLAVMRDETEPDCSLCADFAALEQTSKDFERGCLWEKEPVEVPEVEEMSDAECVKLGCPPGTVVVSSLRSNIYHDCQCHYAKWIKADERICFEKEEYALQAGFSKAQSC